ncbi:glycosyltransferase family 2 protein [Candidatus Woesearchaeota archaeon]|nr:glycosyltransferase family 2 protein [Candidatus Woesearchaeota archaeon]
MVAYTEQDHIRKVITEYYHDVFKRLPKGSEFIVYLDCPPDGTPEIVFDMAKHLDIKPMKGKRNLGYAGAMTTALKATKNDIIFYSDSSGKHHAKDFWDMLQYEKRYDIITGLRKSEKNPFIRRFVTFGQRLLVSMLFNIPPYDFNTGFKIIHKNIIDKVLPDVRYMKQSFSSELLIRALKKGYTVKDVPVFFGKREGKNTGTKIKDLFMIVKKSFKGFLKLRKELR